MPRFQSGYRGGYDGECYIDQCAPSQCAPPPRPCCCPGPAGPMGPVGPVGPVGTILGSYDTLCDLMLAHPRGRQGDAYLVAGDLYVWSVSGRRWEKVGCLIGPQGEQGIQGEQGVQGPPGASFKDSYDSYAEFISEHPTGQPGDAYLVEGRLVVWDETTGRWMSLGSLVGPQGEKGDQGEQGPAGPPLEPDEVLFSVTDQIDSEDVTFGGSLTIKSDSLDITVEQGPVINIEKPAGIGTILPFSTGLPLSIATATGTGLRDYVAMLGFGGASTSSQAGDTINLSSTEQYAVIMPVGGTITAMHALFSKSAGGLAGQNIEIKAQIFSSAQTDNIFYPIDESLIEVGTVVDLAQDGTVYHNSKSDLNIEVEAGTRLLLVFYSETPDYTATLSSVTGYFSASLRIE